MLLKNLAKRAIAFLPLRMACKLQAMRVGGRVAIGSNSFVHGSVHILGKNNVEIGSNTCISEGCWLNVNRRIGRDRGIKIGNNCFIGKQNFFSSGMRIAIGDFTLTTVGCKFIGSSHVISDPLKPYISTGTTTDDVIEIGTNCFIGVNVLVLGNVKIGHGSVVGAGAQVMADVPPFSIAIGIPAKVIKRFSFIKNMWVPQEELTEEEKAAIPDEVGYLERLNANYTGIPMPFIAAARDMGNL